ncbi:hypothetical protein LCI18_013296 [Fusarium solani-melongenae]|uniref:Uncharacterized protein n=1 Tax=Fusarium solani subsp. cucurbitae TaxID=2747967 RepID=A0ACD3ZMP2_FUSSC|nr:hypothetical protein LCI18_013296 [Fusarium solani-melongenae]
MIGSILRPWGIMSISTFYLFATVAKLAFSGDLRTLFSWEAFHDAWFGNFWVYMGPKSKAGAEGWVVPLLEGRVKDGKIHEDAQGPPIDGVILEIGAGSGMWTQVLADVIKKTKPTSEKSSSKIYGVEPNPISAAALKRRVDETGLVGTYEVLPFGIQDLKHETSIGPGSVDCIITIQCLCSIPEPEKNIRLLYDYLKPGGRWYVYEHVKSEQGTVIQLIQRLTNIPWEYLVGSCKLCRPTLRSILKVGDWDRFNVAPLSGESWLEVIPHIAGTLTKAS